MNVAEAGPGGEQRNRPAGFEARVKELSTDSASALIEEIVLAANGEPSSGNRESQFPGWKTDDFAEAARRLGRGFDLDRQE